MKNACESCEIVESPFIVLFHLQNKNKKPQIHPFSLQGSLLNFLLVKVVLIVSLMVICVTVEDKSVFLGLFVCVCVCLCAGLFSSSSAVYNYTPHDVGGSCFTPL